MFTEKLQVIVGISILSVAASAQAVTNIDYCGYQIVEPGTYELTADLKSCPADGIDISVPANKGGGPVTLKLKGFTISGAPGVDGIRAGFGTPRQHHITILGPGLITGFNIGIELRGTDYSLVRGVTITQSSVTGVSTASTTYATIQENIIGRDQGGNGAITTDNCDNCVLDKNDISGSGEGIKIFRGSNVTISNNTVNASTFGAGIYVQYRSIPNVSMSARIFGNTTNMNSTYGIEIDGDPFGGVVKVFSNRSSNGNGLYDMFDVSPTCSGSVWADNVFNPNRANATCIH